MTYEPIDYLPYDFANRRHIGPSPEEMARMFNVLGVSGLDQLVDETVPKAIRQDRPLDFGKPLSERELIYRLREVASKNKVLFENLTALFPRRRFTLERGNGSSEDITGRILDLMAPQGKGQRSLIVSQPKAGKTMMMQQVATAITTNHPAVHLIVLLIDERPEEVTEMQRTVRGEVISSTFDEPAARHVQVAEMVIERAKRLV